VYFLLFFLSWRKKTLSIVEPRHTRIAPRVDLRTCISFLFSKKKTCISSCHRICTGRGAGHCSLSSREWYQKMTAPPPFFALFSFSPFSSTQLGWLLFRYRKFFLLRLHTTGRLLTAKDHFNASQWKNCWNWQTWCMTDRHKNWCYYHIKVWKSQPY